MVELESQGKPRGCRPGITTTGAPMAHEEFPELTHKAKCVLMNTMKGIDVSRPCWDRRFAAAVIREAVRQAGTFTGGTGLNGEVVEVVTLNRIADNLHDLSPPLPTWNEMTEAQKDALAALVMREYTTILQRGIADHRKVQP
jgi:hypothetical protein